MRRAISAACVAMCLALGPWSSAARAQDYDTVRAALDAADYPTAIDALADMAEDGDTLAATLLSYILASGAPDGLPHTRAAAAWLEEAAGQGSAHAMLELGLLYQHRAPALGMDPGDLAAGYPLAIAWFGGAANAGSPLGDAYLGSLYRLRLYSRTNEAMTAEEEDAAARAHLESAAAAGVPFARTRLGMMVRRDDPDRAAELMQAAAASGEAYALGNYALDALQEGGLLGLTDDPAEGYAWALAAQYAIAHQGEGRSRILMAMDFDNAFEYAGFLQEIAAPLSEQQRAAAEAQAAEITAGWMSYMPRGPRPTGDEQPDKGPE